jgi:hypothetical protein
MHDESCQRGQQFDTLWASLKDAVVLIARIVLIANVAE